MVADEHNVAGHGMATQATGCIRQDKTLDAKLGHDTNGSGGERCRDTLVTMNAALERGTSSAMHVGKIAQTQPIESVAPASQPRDVLAACQTQVDQSGRALKGGGG